MFVVKKLSYGLFALLLIGACKQASSTQKKETPIATTEKTYPTVGHIERLAIELDQIIPKDAQIEVVGSGMVWSEGPLWIPSKQWVLCSDVKENRIHKWTPTEGFTTFLEPSGFTGEVTDSREKGSNGLTLAPNGDLVMCQHGDRRVARLLSDLDNPTPKFETIVDNYEGKKFNSPNDLIYDSHGNLYFTDPPFGLSEAMMDDPKKELAFQGVFKYSKDGVLTLLTKEMSRPNGLALSPDEKTLYVSNADVTKAIWMAFPLLADGQLGEGKILHDATALTATEIGVPDGVKVDKQGNIFTAGPGGLWIFAPDGKVLGKIKPGEWVSNCNFDENGKTLYITADDYLMRVKL